MKPLMGFNTWNTFGININEQLIRETADRMVESGLADCGYRYIVIDDGWSMKKRDSEGRLVPDPEKFPNGIRAVADYVHSKGLKFGIYSCAGLLTCGQYPGSYEHEFIDAASFAEWEVDFLKYDYCFKPQNEQGALLYRRMGLALANCGRDIHLNACSWGADETHQWIKTTGAGSWRSTVDIFDTWDSIKSLAKRQKDLFAYNGMHCFNDMDMLVVGMNGKGNVGLQGCTEEEYRTHFTMWALCGSPLFIGCDIRVADQSAINILKNKDVIAIDQDAAYRQPYVFSGSQFGTEEECFCIARLLENGDMAIGMFNFADDARNMTFYNTELGLSRGTGKDLALKNLWTGADEHTVGGVYAATVPAHGCLLFRATLKDAR